MQQTTLYQLKTESTVISGMSYVVKCGDGSIFVIDGGYDHGDAEILMTFLKGLTQSDHPVVDAWLITHGHPDHTGALYGVAKRHYKEITVKKLIYRWPDKAFIDASQPVINQQLASLEAELVNLNAEHVVPKTGDVYRFGDTEFEVMLTCDQLPETKPGDHTDFNDSSTVVRLKANGQTVLFLGDVAAAGDRVMIEKHGKNLKSDVCQLAHHGHFSSTSEFYDYVDPEILLWPADETRIPLLMKYIGVDYHVAYEMNVREIVLAHWGTRCLPLPIKPTGDSYWPPRECHKKDPTPAFGILRAPDGFNWTDSSDPAWNTAEKAELIPENPGRIKAVSSGEARFLWDGVNIYFMIDHKKEIVPPQPDSFGTTDSTNVRLYFSETAVLDYYADWKDIAGEGTLEKLMFYPEIKSAFGAYTDRPDLCEARCEAIPGGYRVLAKLPLAKKHSAGDLISVNLKASGNDVPGGSRTSCISMIDPEDARFVYKRPACLCVAELK